MPGRPPFPSSAGAGVLQFDGGAFVQALHVVVLALRRGFRLASAVGGAFGFGVVGEGLFERPAEAAGLVLVAGFDDKENGADLEEGGAYE